jgi:hypothetical protein
MKEITIGTSIYTVRQRIGVSVWEYQRQKQGRNETVIRNFPAQIRPRSPSKTDTSAMGT